MIIRLVPLEDFIICQRILLLVCSYEREALQCWWQHVRIADAFAHREVLLNICLRGNGRCTLLPHQSVQWELVLVGCHEHALTLVLTLVLTLALTLTSPIVDDVGIDMSMS